MKKIFLRGTIFTIACVFLILKVNYYKYYEFQKSQETIHPSESSFQANEVYSNYNLKYLSCIKTDL